MLLVFLQACPEGQPALLQQYTAGNTLVHWPFRQSSPWLQSQADLHCCTGHRPRLPLLLKQLKLEGQPGLLQQNALVGLGEHSPLTQECPCLQSHGVWQGVGQTPVWPSLLVQASPALQPALSQQ